MNKVFTILLIFVLTITAQDKNKTTIDTKSGTPMLVGLCDREAFADTNFAWWFNSGYKFYDPDADVVSKILDVKTEYSITIVMGTWCSDSRREVPRFYKLLDALNFSEGKIELINVDRSKSGIDADVSNLKIELVPTFIVYSNGKEMGRIIETPEESLEIDLLKILIQN
ncbi:MAG: thioredoxin family protein [Melioribacteraceae bacterium]|jgi:thiol-disulfide isomerase/thioredoxin|nr:thioredoxin family protein [Melioribacteraceae bacterium]